MYTVKKKTWKHAKSFQITRHRWVFLSVLSTSQHQKWVTIKMAYVVYRSPMIVNMITQAATLDRWYPVPIKLVNITRCEAGLNTSPWTCFHPYSSPRSLSWTATRTCNYVLSIKVAAIFEPNSPPSWSLFQFPYHEETRSITTPLWMGYQSMPRLSPTMSLSLPDIWYGF